jgi:hypothetical protein
MKRQWMPSMTCSKYVLVMVVLASWFVAAVLFVNGSFVRYALLFVTAAFSLAVLLLALSALIWRGWMEEFTFGLERKFLLCGPPALAAIFSVAIIVYEMGYRNLCSAFDDCLSLDAFRHHIPSFVIGWARISLEFYAIIATAALFVLLLRTIDEICRRNR